MAAMRHPMASITLTVTPFPACFVGLVIALDGQHRVDAIIRPALQTQAFARCQAADATLAQNTVTVFVVSVCMGAPGLPVRSVLRARSDLMGFFDRANFNSALLAARCKCMRNLFTDPSAPTVDCGVAQVDAVTDLCHLVAGFVAHLIGTPTLVQPGLAAEPARIGSQRTT